MKSRRERERSIAKVSLIDMRMTAENTVVEQHAVRIPGQNNVCESNIAIMNYEVMKCLSLQTMPPISFNAV